MASTLVHLNCTKLTNGMAMDLETGSLGEPEVASKRDHDGMDDSDLGQVKKRRKQSKPMRIASSESTTTIVSGTGNENEAKPTTWALDNSSKNGSFSIPAVENSVPEPNPVIERTQNAMSEFEPEDTQMSLNQLSSETQNNVLFPLNLSNAKSPSPQNSVESSLDEKSSWYKMPESSFHLPPSDTSKVNSFLQNNLLVASQSSPLLLPSFKRVIINNDSQLPSSHRIFNPEAFCDLCNKEFCNKYFLKTHRANKHGIYTETTGPNLMESLTSVPAINYFTNFSNQPLNQQKKTCTFPPSNTKPTSGASRAFCNICQREFCNKYFVRRHKAKIHGIIDPGSQDESDQKPSFSERGSDSSDVNVPGPSCIKTKEPNENLFEEVKVKKEQDVDSDDTTSPQTALNLLVTAWQNEETKDRPISPDRLKKLGVVNNNAYCDICCKEYCNKYFLRTHKQKCHGIVTPEKDEKPTIQGNTGNNGWKMNQSMPLNLILRESNKERPSGDEDLVTCSLCKMTFYNSHMLKLHFEQAHRPRATTPQEQKLISNDLNRIKYDSNGSGNETQDSKTPPIQSLPPPIKNNFAESSICEICSKDIGQASLLEAHILKEHSKLIEDLSTNLDEENSSSPIGTTKFDCPKCQKSFSSFDVLEQHLSEHETKPQRNGAESIDSTLLFPSDRPNVQTPTSSFCEICKKELCNKYFMKTHMQRMHGISIENGAHIGGVVCDICNKELCSKYFLRVHKQNSHGIVEEAFLPQIGTDVKPLYTGTDSALRPTEGELNNRYFSHFTEVCSICNRRFRSSKWLKAHLLNDHGEEGKDKWKEFQNGTKHGLLLDKKTELPSTFSMKLVDENRVPSTSEAKSDEKSPEVMSLLNSNSQKQQYQCSYCQFTTPVMALLFFHERSHLGTVTDLQLFQCSICMTSFETGEMLERHLLVHQTNMTSSEPRQPQETYSSKKENEKKDDNNSNEFQRSGESILKCFQCNFTTQNSDYFTEHLKQEHRIDNSNGFQQSGETILKCFQCNFTTNHLDHFTEHLKQEHRIDETNIGSLQIYKDALLQIAQATLIPASFALPKNFGHFIMQPFVLEDKAFGANSQSSFLSSLVFLPVKERLNRPITASFKLTPT